MGERVRQEEVLDTEHLFNKRNLAPGLYFFNLSDRHQLLYKGRFIIQP